MLDYCETDLAKLSGLEAAKTLPARPEIVTDPETLLGLLADTARGLGYIHSRGQLHCDVKPENILVANVGTAEAPVWRGRVSDFGMEVATNPTTWVGSYLWMAPECTGLNKKREPGDVGYGADVFSFAIMTWMIMNHEERWFSHRSDDLPRLWVNSDGSEDRKVGKGCEPKNADGSLAGEWKEDLRRVAVWYNAGQRPEFPDDWLRPNLRVLIEAAWVPDPKQRPTCKSIGRLMASGEMLARPEPEPEPEPASEESFDDFLLQLGLTDKKDDLADYLEEGNELRDLKQMDEDDLNEDILDDDDLGLDEDVKVRFRDAVVVLRAATASAETLDAQSPKQKFDALLATIGSTADSAEYLEPAPVQKANVAPTLQFLREDGTSPPMAERQYDVFINHCQGSGQDQCGNLSKLLQGAGCKVWYDMQAQDLTAQGMEEGVSQSRCVLMFLSDDLMGRPFCQAEQRWGKLYGCRFIGVVEKDSRHGAADFGKEKDRAPADLKYLMDDVEFIEYRRRDFEAKAMVAELMRRVRAPFDTGAPPLPEPELEPEC